MAELHEPAYLISTSRRSTAEFKGSWHGWGATRNSSATWRSTWDCPTPARPSESTGKYNGGDVFPFTGISFDFRRALPPLALNTDWVR